MIENNNIYITYIYFIIYFYLIFFLNVANIYNASHVTYLNSCITKANVDDEIYNIQTSV